MVIPKKAVKKSPRGRGRPSIGCTEALYLRVTPELLANLRQDCEDTGLNTSPPDMARKILTEHYKNRSARR